MATIRGNTRSNLTHNLILDSRLRPPSVNMMDADFRKPWARVPTAAGEEESVQSMTKV
jgi:hypothetical protein